jgi:hypothetical protein
MCKLQDAKNEKKFRDVLTDVSKNNDKFNVLWADPVANPQVVFRSALNR